MTTLETVDKTPPDRSPLGSRTVHRAIPLRRIVTTELRKMFDTRAGYWLMASIGISALLATGGVALFASDSQTTYANFTKAIGFPMAAILPVVAILSVTGLWPPRGPDPRPRPTLLARPAAHPGGRERHSRHLAQTPATSSTGGARGARVPGMHLVTLYGLGAGVWTRGGSRAYRVGKGIQAGRVWTNRYHAYPAGAAFGRYQGSGVGRETPR